MNLPAKSWVLSQLLWVSHKIRFSWHSDGLPKPRHLLKARSNCFLRAELTKALAPRYKEAFRQQKTIHFEISLRYLWFLYTTSYHPLAEGKCIRAATQELPSKSWVCYCVIQCFGSCHSYLVPLTSFLLWFPKVSVGVDDSVFSYGISGPSCRGGAYSPAHQIQANPKFWVFLIPLALGCWIPQDLWHQRKEGT